MDGISYLTDEENNKVAVMIDLQKHGDLWEDFYDLLIAEERKSEESISWEEAEKELTEKKLL